MAEVHGADPPEKNIVLTGMPSSGKTTVGRLLADILGRTLIDTDEEVIRLIGMPISDYFRANGETAFRDIESAVISRISRGSGLIIATGGGVVKRQANMEALAGNGVIVWLDRDAALLTPTDDRPLARKRSDMERLREEREPLYQKYCDIRISNNDDPEKAADEIINILRLL